MRAWLLWLLMLALPLYGATGTQLRMLGPAHWHAVPVSARAAPDEGAGPGWLGRLLNQVQQLRDEAHLRAHVLGRASAPHSHFGLQHHWHDRADDSVRHAADPAVADLVAGAEVGSAMLVLGAPVQHECLPGAPGNGRWPCGDAPRWADAPRHLASPPPRA